MKRDGIKQTKHLYKDIPLQHSPQLLFTNKLHNTLDKSQRGSNEDDAKLST